MISLMVIPENARVDGSVEVSLDLEVRGRCDGHIQVGGALLVARGATCRATLRAKRAEIFGEVIGDVICTDAIDVAAGARVVGDIRAPEISVDAAAEVDGRVDLLPPAPEEIPLRRAPVGVRGKAPRRPMAPRRSTGH